MGLTAADYALIGALGAAAIGQVGATINGERERQHEHRMALADSRRRAFQDVISASGEFVRRAASIASLAEAGGEVTALRRDEYLAARRELAHALSSSRLYSTGVMRERCQEVDAARGDVHAWLSTMRTGVRNESRDVRTSRGIVEALEKFRLAEAALLDALQPHLLID
jgi:hypothetical protein